MDIGDQWSFPDLQSPEVSDNATPAVPNTVPPDHASAMSPEGFDPEFQPVVREDGEHADFWTEFENLDFAASKSGQSVPAPGITSLENRSRHWVALLTDNAALRDVPIELAQKEFLEWLVQSAERIAGDLSGFPETFQTTGFWSEIKLIQGPVRFLKTISDKLHSGTIPFHDAVDCLGRNFGWDEQQLFKWKQELENLAGLRRWLPAFTHAYEYLSAAFPLGIEKPDRLRTILIQSVEEPHCFLQPSARNEFDGRFLEFKKSYMDSYFLLHEDALHVMNGLRKDEVRVDSAALRNLELLSSLQHTDQSYLNRVKLLARWIQHNQCNLPLHQILETYPRCYCNFNPGRHQQPESSAARINAIIQEGLEYFRTILRRCGHLILLEAKAQPVEDESLRQITAALSDGPMIPLKAQSIKILNKIIAGNSGEFLSEIRKAQK